MTAKQSKNKITICTESPFGSIVDDLILYYNINIDENTEFEVTELSDISQERQTQVKKLRTELMAGRGKDIYLLKDNPYAYSTEEAFLLDVNKTLYNDTWADLSDYVKNDKTMQDCFEPVMKAGQDDGKQYILPLTFDCNIIKMDQSVADTVGFDMNDTLTPLSDLIKSGKIDKFSPYNFMIFPKNWIGSVVDYQKQEITVTEDEIKSIMSYGVKEAFRKDVVFEINILSASDEITADYSSEEVSKNVYYPMFTMNGKPFSNVISYGAISENCKNKDSAYKFLSLLWKNDFMSGKGIALGEETNENSYKESGAIYTLDGIPVQKSAWESWFTGEYNKNQNEQKKLNRQRDLDNFIKVLEQIKVCQFYGSYDREIVNVNKIFESPTKEYHYTNEFDDIDERIDKATQMIYDNLKYSAFE